VTRRLAIALLTAAVLAGAAAPALAARGKRPAPVIGARLDCPVSVPEGQPFFVRVETVAPMTAVRATWLGRTLTPALEPGARGVNLLLGLGLHERQPGGEFDLRVALSTASGDTVLTATVRRLAKAYPEQHLDVARRFTDMSAADLARHEREKAAVAAVLCAWTPARAWRYPLARPLPGAVTSAFGLRRFFNGEPKLPHAGVDLRGKTGTPVRTCAAGRVVLAGDHFFAGGSVYVDHGQGLVSMYFHLSEILVVEGQELARGEVLGRVGETGRVTGPHLHWGLAVQGQLVDPLLLAERPAKKRRAP